MKLKNLFAGMLLCLAVASCIQDEALNVEAAIDGCSGNDIQQCLIDPNEFTVQLYVSRAADPSKININFDLPAGASIAPVKQLAEDGVNTYNFKDENNPREFKVTSEDSDFSATYTIRLWQTEMPITYNFETLRSDNPYHKFTEENPSAGAIIRRLELASGNPGFELTKMAKTPEDYPTVQVNGGVDGGKCVKLETKNTGSFGSMVNMHIAAGNLFIGSFEVGQALSDAMKATHFGFPFFYYPLELKGSYKYKAGPIFSSKGVPVEGKKDKCDIYGVLYETDANVQFLDGSTSLNSPNIVALARNLEKLPETDSWTEFSFKFEPKNGKSIDSDKLEKGIYKLAIVFSSSVDGAKFEGAVGSTLYVDKVKIVQTSDPNEYPAN